MKNLKNDSMMQDLSMEEMREVNGGSLLALAAAAAICILVLKSDT